jgi:hypothetical protein
MFEKCGVYLSVSINLVICGAIVYYFHKKVNSLEIALMKQSQLFSSFIQDFQRDMNRVNNNNNQTLASPEAIIAVSKLNFDGGSMNNKIEVSDDSESESSDSDSSDSESESDNDDIGDCEVVDISDSINENEDSIKRINLSDFEVVDDHLNIESMDLNTMDLGGLSNEEVFEMMTSAQLHNGAGGGGFVVINGMPMMMNMNNMNNINNMNNMNNNNSSSYIEEIKDEQEIKEDKKIIILKDDSSDDDDDDSSDEEEEENEKEKEKDIKKPKKVLNKKNIIMMDIHDLSNTDLLKVEKKEEKIENMKIDDLRKMVIDKSLALKENVKKMKKPELLQLLFEKK